MIIIIIITKEANKGSGVVILDREDCSTEAKKRLNVKEVYQELKGDAEDQLDIVIKKWYEKYETQVT